MCDFLPTDDEGLRQWCRHQITHVPQLGPGIGLKAAEIAVFVDDCRILMDAAGGERRREAADADSKAARKHLVRIKKTSLRRQVEQAKARTGYAEDKGTQLQWVEAGGREKTPVLAGKATGAKRRTHAVSHG